MRILVEFAIASAFSRSDCGRLFAKDCSGISFFFLSFSFSLFHPNPQMLPEPMPPLASTPTNNHSKFCGDVMWEMNNKKKDKISVLIGSVDKKQK